jgi:hypothetical protein
LASAPAGRDLLARAPGPLRICFVEIPVAAVTTEGTFLLDPRTPDAESAARLGHLLLHQIEGGLNIEGAPDRPCERVVDQAIWAEARAHALELELRRALGVTDPRRRFPFEDAFWAAPPEERVATLHHYFRAHPEGDSILPGFVSAYAARCDGALDIRREK